MNNKHTDFDRKRAVTVFVAILSIVVLAFAGLLLTGCHRKTPPASSGPSAPSKTPVSSGTLPWTTEEELYCKKEGTVYFSPSSISVTGKGIYATDATNFALYKLSPEGNIEKTVSFRATVSKVKVDGEKVYVLSGDLNGNLSVFDENLNFERSVKVGHTPSDIYLNDGKAYVANRFSNTVSVVELGKGEVVSEISVSREPVCMTALGNNLYVGCLLQDNSVLGNNVSCKVEKIDMTSGKISKSISLQNGAQSIRGILATEDGKIIVTHLVSRYTYPTTQLDRGWINTNAFSIIDGKDDSVIGFLLDEVEKGAGNPWDVAFSADKKNLIFSLSGTNELMTVDYTKLNSRVNKVVSGKDSTVRNVNEIVDHIEFLNGIKKRLTLPGDGARDVEVYDGKVYVAQYFSGDIVVIDEKCENVLTSYSLGKQPEMTAERMGESIWYSANYCYQQWESCASCHPDGRVDALNWDNMNDGIGNPKNTKSMIFSHRTPPVMVTGIRDSAETAVRKGMLFIQFNVMDEEKLCAIDAYLKAMLPLESPALTEDGTYSEAALRGKKLFDEVGCAVCHPAPLYTDLKFHKSPYLGSDGTWENREFVTPTLVEIWRSAPYTYSGAVSDIGDVISKFANRKLDASELADLKQFVLSIGIVEEYYGVEQVFFKDSEGNTFYNMLEKGTTLTSFTLRKQIPSESNVKDPIVVLKLCDNTGKTLEEKIFQPGKLVYNTAVSVECNIRIPENLNSGSYVEIIIKDDSDKELASAFRLSCNK